MSEEIKDLINKALEDTIKEKGAISFHREHLYFAEKLAELIVKECADAADDAYNARCVYQGDYVVEHMGLGEAEGSATWRTL